ncbi:MAG: NUDIX hydrolase [Nanohaloarchaea archaeon QH_8_44_6]|nr:MAG: NUDIX hydrolase [Nanohaloarchaea archaeon QH_8_44_6]
MKELAYCHKCGTELESRKHEDRERYYCPECSEIRYRNSVPVAGVFVVRGDEVLLIKRGNEPHKNEWSYPAGYLEFDEKPEEGAVRELKEETSLTADQKELELVTTIHLEHPDKYVVGNAYTVSFDRTEGEIKAGSDAKDAEFLMVEEMRSKVSQIESPKIIEAAEEAIRTVNRQG